MEWSWYKRDSGEGLVYRDIERLGLRYESGVQRDIDKWGWCTVQRHIKRGWAGVLRDRKRDRAGPLRDRKSDRLAYRDRERFGTAVHREPID